MNFMLEKASCVTTLLSHCICFSFVRNVKRFASFIFDLFSTFMTRTMPFLSLFLRYFSVFLISPTTRHFFVKPKNAKIIHRHINWECMEPIMCGSCMKSSEIHGGIKRHPNAAKNNCKRFPRIC